jgi:ABC-type branched-subunit amino acid transport system ATPase component
MTASLLKIEHLEVRYGDLIGVSDVSLDVPEGSVVALLGSNGGGKTTVLNAIAGLIPLHSGSIDARRRYWSVSTRFFRNLPSGAASARAPCQVANVRCWLSVAP